MTTSTTLKFIQVHVTIHQVDQISPSTGAVTGTILLPNLGRVRRRAVLS
jgi:hypothetical protein